MSTTPIPSPAGRGRLTRHAAEQLLWWAPTLLALVASVLGGALALLTIGLVLLVWAAPLQRRIADRHRRMAADILGFPVVGDHLPVPAGTNVVGRVVIWARDPMTWREIAWMVCSLTVGFACALVAVLLFVMVLTGALWWFGVTPIMRARARCDCLFLAYGRMEQLERRVVNLAESRAEVVDDAAAELRRIERDLHDGAQARLVAVSMTLGMAEASFPEDPQRARELLGDARRTTSAAIDDLRTVVRGIHPPVLADRGLPGAITALALDMAIPVEVDARLTGRLPAPVETALYFAVAECLANIGKHAGAEHGWVRLEQEDGVLRAVVGDDGRGGADPASGTGIAGVARRLSAFDGTLSLSSPVGGPTIATLEVPCDSSSPRTMPSSARA